MLNINGFQEMNVDEMRATDGGTFMILAGLFSVAAMVVGTVAAGLGQIANIFASAGAMFGSMLSTR